MQCEWSTSLSGLFTPRKETLVPIEQEATLATESVWAFLEKRKNSLPLPGFETPVVQPVAQ
jgi:hypothetical protein